MALKYKNNARTYSHARREEIAKSEALLLQLCPQNRLAGLNPDKQDKILYVKKHTLTASVFFLQYLMSKVRRKIALTIDILGESTPLCSFF